MGGYAGGNFGGDGGGGCGSGDWQEVSYNGGSMDAGKRILIVEDEVVQARALEIKLKRSGYETEIVLDGEEASGILGKEKFDLVLLDLVLPKKDGFAVMEEMRARGDHTPIVVISNLGQKEDIDRAKAMDAKYYFVKADSTLSGIADYIDSIV